MKVERRWAMLFAVFALCRLISIGAMYGLRTPNGVGVVMLPLRFLQLAITAEVALLALLAAALLIGAQLTAGRPRARHAFVVVAFGALALHLVLSEVDVHLRRWMGARLNVIFLRRFADSSTSPGFYRSLAGFLWQDKAALLVSLALVTCPAAAAWLAVRSRASAALRMPRARWLALVAAMALGRSIWVEPAARKWRLGAPYVASLAIDVGRAARSLGAGLSPIDVAALASFVAHVEPATAHPLWHEEPTERESLERFRAKPLVERPDVILVAIESLRGWVLDFRSPRAVALAPRLHALWKERGVAFVHHHSNGFPSGEGNMNLHLGLWSHPSRAIAAEHLAIRTRALADILGDAGYYRLWFTGSDPSFDNLQHLMRRSFDGWGLIDADDKTLATHVASAVHRRPPDRPLFLSVYTRSTHTPYALPNEATPSDPDEAYERALHFADAAVGMLVDTVRQQGRFDETLFVIVGDHSHRNAWHDRNEGDVGRPNASHTWTGMLIAGPGMEAGATRHDATSHVDVPPTILGRIGVRASNHFLGRDVVAEKSHGAVAVLYDGVSHVRDEHMMVGETSGDRALSWRYDVGPLELPASYRHGESLPVSPSDRASLASLQSAVRAYAWLVDHDRVMP